MNKQELLDFLDQKGVKYEKYEHEPVFHVSDPCGEIPHAETIVKNLFLRDKKKKNYVLLTVQEHESVDLKAFAEKIGLTRLSFASPEDLLAILELTPGSVTPFGLLNDEERKVKFYLSSFYKDGYISCHPNENTAAVYLKTDDLLALIAEHGTSYEFVDLEE